jgi:hypothetical protein
MLLMPEASATHNTTNHQKVAYAGLPPVCAHDPIMIEVSPPSLVFLPSFSA